MERCSNRRYYKITALLIAFVLIYSSCGHPTRPTPRTAPRLAVITLMEKYGGQYEVIEGSLREDVDVSYLFARHIYQMDVYAENLNEVIHVSMSADKDEMVDTYEQQKYGPAIEEELSRIEANCDHYGWSLSKCEPYYINYIDKTPSASIAQYRSNKDKVNLNIEIEVYDSNAEKTAESIFNYIKIITALGYHYYHIDFKYFNPKNQLYSFEAVRTSELAPITSEIILNVIDNVHAK